MIAFPSGIHFPNTLKTGKQQTNKNRTNTKNKQTKN